MVFSLDRAAAMEYALYHHPPPPVPRSVHVLRPSSGVFASMDDAADGRGERMGGFENMCESNRLIFEPGRFSRSPRRNMGARWRQGMTAPLCGWSGSDRSLAS